MDNKSDQSLIKDIHNGRSESSVALKIRYRPKIKSLMERHLGSIKKKMSLSMEDLYPDIDSEVWQELLIKPESKLKFDQEGSIGGLIHCIASTILLEKYYKSEATRIGISVNAFKKATEEERKEFERFEITRIEENSDSSAEYSTSEKIQNENTFSIEESLSDANFLLSILNQLPEKLQKVAELKAWGFSQEKIAEEMEVTDRTIRNYEAKIYDLANEIKSREYSE